MLDAKLVQCIVSRAEAFTGKVLRVTVIENPVAGGFTRKREAAQNRRWLAEALERADALPVRTASCEVTVLQTKAAGHAQVLARDVINAALADDSPNALYLTWVRAATARVSRFRPNSPTRIWKRAL